MSKFDKNMYYIHQDGSIRSYNELLDIWEYECKEDEDIANECPTLDDYIDYCNADMSGDSTIEPVEFVRVVNGVGAIYSNGADDLLFNNDGSYLDTIYDDDDLEYYTNPRDTYSSVDKMYFYTKKDFNDAVDLVLDREYARPSGINNSELSISFSDDDFYFDTIEFCDRNHIKYSDKVVVKESKTMKIRKIVTESKSSEKVLCKDKRGNKLVCIDGDTSSSTYSGMRYVIFDSNGDFVCDVPQHKLVGKSYCDVLASFCEGKSFRRFGKSLTEKWVRVKTKKVQDVWDANNKVSYTMYKNTDEQASPKFVFTYDNARVSDEDWDYECDNEEEAMEWFNSYNGGLDESFTVRRTRKTVPVVENHKRLRKIRKNR